MARIVVVVHSSQSSLHESYYLHGIAQVWRAQGHVVKVVADPGRHEPADVAISHVDLTVVPEPYLACLNRYPVTLNAKVRDISKRTVSAHLVRRGDGYDGPVIVKANLNCGGGPERRLREYGARWRRRLHRLRARLPWALRATYAGADYRVFGSVREVPLAARFNPHLLMERFLPERDGDLYCLRTWTFLGDAWTHSLSWSREPVIKGRNVIRREALGEVPPALTRRRRELGFDYGKFDYVMRDGEPVLFDANRTPAARAIPESVSGPNSRLLATGLRAFI